MKSKFQPTRLSFGEKIAVLLTTNPLILEVHACIWSVLFPLIFVFNINAFPVNDLISSNLFFLFCISITFSGVLHLISLWFNFSNLRIYASILSLIFWLYVFLLSITTKIDNIDHMFIYAMNSVAYTWVSLRLVMMNHLKNIKRFG